MQRVTVVRYPVKADRAAENEALSRAVFAELRAKAPAHVGYAVFRKGPDFLHVFINLRDEDAEVLTGLSSFKAFSEAAGERYASPPEVMRSDMELVDAFGVSLALQPA